MTATLSMVPLAQIRPTKANPRTEFDDERMAELIESVKRHGIISPLTLSRDGEGRYAIIAGERRYRAAKAAKLREVPAQVREVDGEALTLAVAENVIRADLSPLEEARAYRRLVEEHGDTAKVAKLVGKSERLVSERLDLLRLPDETQELLAARKLPLACAPALIQIAEREPLLADVTAAWLAERPQDAAGFPSDPGEVVDDVLAAEWTNVAGQPRHPVAYSVGGYYGPILPRGRARADAVPAVLAKLGAHAEAVEAAFGALPEVKHTAEYDWQAREREERRQRDCFALSDQDADAARAFGCLLELPDPNGRGDHRYATDPEWLADRLVQKIAAHVTAEEERKQHGQDGDKRATVSDDDPEKQARREQRQRDYEARVYARGRNLELGAALAKWQPKLDTEAVKLLGSLVLLHYGKAAAWAHRLCIEQPTTNKQGKVTVRYPRGAQAEKQLHAEAAAALMRTRTPEAALAVVLRLLLAQRLADTAGLPNADRQGIYEPLELSGSKVLAKLARRVAPPSVKQHLAAEEAERERREQVWRDEQAAKLQEQRDKLAAGEPIRCECCLGMIESGDAAAEKDGTLVHAGDCEQQWGSAYNAGDDNETDEEALD
jgi:ParB/RepB/Spo0J family partition protein